MLAGKARLNAQTVNNLNRKAFQSNITSHFPAGPVGGVSMVISKRKK